MSTITTNDLKNGMTLNLDDGLFQVVDFQHVKPGKEIDRVCRSIIADAGYGDAFSHGTGHGVGLDIHELPAVHARSTAILQPGHVLTVEPGIYVPAFGGCRVEDLLVVTETGCRPLTNTPKSTC